LGQLRDRPDNFSTNEIEIYPYAGADTIVQYCTSQTLAVGGGIDWSVTGEGYSPYVDRTSTSATTGIGFLLDNDLVGGESNSYITYANPQLLDHHLKNGTTTAITSSPKQNDDVDRNMNVFDFQTIEVYKFTEQASNNPKQIPLSNKRSHGIIGTWERE
jgi:diketogulonate reductase-like aldo/keto reductase